METLFVVEEHKNQYYSRSKPQGHARFVSSPSRDFRGINCRTFESGRAGILPTPLKSHGSPKTPSNSDSKMHGKATPKSTPIPINGKGCRKETTFTEDVPGGSLLLSELWAGPTYSNSPPPSSLPIPKFSVRPKRTVSLNLPGSSPEIEMRQMAKSAPSSPGREHLPFTRDLFVNADSATKTLRRILNLNINDD
ncbi:uncharacterized protein LOC113872406 [Abrus precatorius]|uniref:Uncharacterized protein LOC113872406 n=1 Tax=Abrus precatorius TaxID=3816 RepID=A0A8B8MD06_ABRPR|nr:uncharacterized protein LOC113872406 [Abrus precatorius]XP_027365739.1 uncharacterized protein LOC113872406 [Abrus precatorius]